MASDVALRARLQQQPLLAQFARQIRNPRRAKRCDGAVRLAIGQIDHGKARCDLRARSTLQPLVDLILQEFAGLVEQIDRDQPIGEMPDHLVAAPPDRRQFAVFIKHPERLDRRQIVALRAEKELLEQGRRRVLAGPRNFCIGLQLGRGLGCREGFAIAAGIGIDPRQHFQRLHLDHVAAPRHRQRLQLAQRVGRADLVALLPQRYFVELGFGRRGPIRRFHRVPVIIQRIHVVSERLGQPAAQHRYCGLHLVGKANDIQIAGALGGTGVILDLDRGTHRIRYHDALQVDRQRGDR